MKKIRLFSCFAAAVLFGRQIVNAQIVWEHTYPSAQNQLYMVTLEVEGMKYVHRDWVNLQIVLYNLDHSVFKIISLPNITVYNQSLLYVSEHLFNLDDSLEFMMVYSLPGHWQTLILNEVGDTLFYGYDYAPLVQGNVPQTQQPIYNTPNGTRMILSQQTGIPVGEVRVYRLGGTLTNSIEPIGLSSEDIEQLSIHPNPSNGNTTIEFKFPQGIGEGEIVLYNMDGSEVKRYRVDGTFGNLNLNNSHLTAGAYMYQLIAGNRAVDAKRMIVVH
jgi:hypothetical protein